MNPLKKLINIITRNKSKKQYLPLNRYEDPIIRGADTYGYKDYYPMGLSCINLEDYKGAVIYLTEAITGTYGYKYIEALMLRAEAYELLNQYDKAISDLKQLKRAISDFNRIKRLYPDKEVSRELLTYRSCFSHEDYYVSSYRDHPCDKELLHVSSFTGDILLGENHDEKIKKLEIKQAYKDFARTLSRLIK